MDARSTQRFRVNGNRPIHQPNSLLHARETETSTLHCRFQVEPSPRITDEEMNPTGIFPQLYFKVYWLTSSSEVKQGAKAREK
jgi:hypothetical protein